VTVYPEDGKLEFGMSKPWQVDELDIACTPAEAEYTASPDFEVTVRVQVPD